jgi:ubiquinone biosynthesis protein
MIDLGTIGAVGKTYRHINRYRQILTILVKYGFDNIIELLKIDQYLETGLQMISLKRRDRVEKLTPQERVRLIFEELGPTFIKFGQILSTRPDLVPLTYIAELENLQDNVPSFSFVQVQSIVESELGTMESHFLSMEETPFASASIGQVHLATLTTHERVAVKIQRPGIKKVIKVDLEIMLHLATLMERHIEDLSFFQPVKIVEEFAATLERELDYSLEASNIKRVAKQFENNLTIHIPKVFFEHTTASILTMEYIQGIKISHIDALDEQAYDRRLLTRQGADFILTQVLTHGFFHGDLHPGNLFVLPGNVLCPVDFGIMGFVDQYTREVFVDLIASTVMQKTATAAQLLLELTDYEEEPDMRVLEKDIANFIGYYFTRELKDIDLGRMLQELVVLTLNHRLKIFPETFLMMKSFAAVEGVAHILDPHFDMISHAAPYIKNAKKARFAPGRISDDINRITTESFQFFQHVPRESLAILRQVRRGQLVMGIDLSQLDKILASHHQANNKLALSVIVGSLLLGSSFLMSFKVPPLFWGLSIIGLAGMVGAGLIGFGLFISIMKNG